MKSKTCIILMVSLFMLAKACPPDTSSIGIAFNNGEYTSFGKIESYGSANVNYLKDYIPDLSPVPNSDLPVIPSEDKTHLISDSFIYDPEITSDFSIKPMAIFNGDTLTINDYWALAEQPEFRCSLSVSNDTIGISYIAISGMAKDWMPTVATSLKIHLSNPSPTMVLHFKAVSRFARDPQKVGFRDGTEDYYAAVPVPPLATYKFRAHSFPYAMVFLSYEQYSNTYKLCPRVTVTIDTDIPIIASIMIPDLITLLINELQWLSTTGICIPTENTMAKLFSISSKGYSGNGAYFWSKQDSVVGLNQWFTIHEDSVQIWSIRGGCGLGTDFSLPPEDLSTPIKRVHDNSYGGEKAKITLHKKTLYISSQESFNKVQLFNLLGREVYGANLKVPSMTAVLSLKKQEFIKSGKYILNILNNQKKIGSRLLSF